MTHLLIAALLAAAPTSRHDAALIDKAKALVASKARDPASANFRNVRVGPGQSGGKAVCGEVNAKNGFGGYAGFRGFVYESAFDDVRLEGGDDQMYYLWSKDCDH